MQVRFNTKAITQIWEDVDPYEGQSEWYDLETGYVTTDRRKAIAWVRENGRGLRHAWRLD